MDTSYSSQKIIYPQFILERSITNLNRNRNLTSNYFIINYKLLCQVSFITVDPNFQIVSAEDLNEVSFHPNDWEQNMYFNCSVTLCEKREKKNLRPSELIRVFCSKLHRRSADD